MNAHTHEKIFGNADLETPEIVTCMLCEERVHYIKGHLDKKHEGVSIDQYVEKFPTAPLISAKGKEIVESRLKEAARKRAMTQYASTARPLAEVFGFPPEAPGMVSAKTGKPLMVSVMTECHPDFRDHIPTPDPRYVFNPDILKVAVMALELNDRLYLVGHLGTGKSSVIKQICALTQRPMMRLQHTVNTEESHITGQYVVKARIFEGKPVAETVWEPGPLQIAMKYGLVLLLDEYDRAMPQVTSVYQAVLEGEPLYTKEAPPEWQIVKPHPDFRLIGTGNTNGTGDPTGLYASTTIQDFSNYERWTIMLRVSWMPQEQEVFAISAATGNATEDARQMVRFASLIREEHEQGKIKGPITLRSMIAWGKLARRLGSFTRALDYTYIERLDEVDAEVARRVAQRIFDGA